LTDQRSVLQKLNRSLVGGTSTVEMVGFRLSYSLEFCRR
jgi:hypothetical protein